jgi:uncharacterized membrane protein YjfL (UPF0719 family)
MIPAMPLPILAEASTALSWHATTLPGALLHTAIFTLAGILLAIAGYKLFDLCTPGDLHREIVEHKNLAAAMIGGAIIIGVCVIVAAAIMG